MNDDQEFLAVMAATIASSMVQETGRLTRDNKEIAKKAVDLAEAILFEIEQRQDQDASAGLSDSKLALIQKTGDSDAQNMASEILALRRRLGGS